MRIPYLVAALSGGLREGVGHVTLVSDETVAGGAASARATQLASVVREGDQPFLVGDDFIGVRNESAVQAAGGRLAPEALLLCNLRTGRLSEEKRQHILMQLRARVEALHELRDDCPTRASKTVIASRMLAQWLRADGFDALPPHRVIAAPAPPRDPAARSRWPIYLAVLACVAAAAGAVVWFATGDSRRAAPQTAPQQAGGNDTKPPPTQPPADPHLKMRTKWYKDLDAEVEKTPLNRPTVADLITVADIIDSYLTFMLGDSSWPKGEQKPAYEKLQQLYETVRAKGNALLTAAITDAKIKLEKPPLAGSGLGPAFEDLKKTVEMNAKLDQKLREIAGRLFEPGRSPLDPAIPTKMPASDARSRASDVLLNTFDAKVAQTLKLDGASREGLNWLKSLRDDPNRAEYLGLIADAAKRERVQQTLTAVKDTAWWVTFQLNIPPALDDDRRLPRLKVKVGDQYFDALPKDQSKSKRPELFTVSFSIFSIGRHCELIMGDAEPVRFQLPPIEKILSEFKTQNSNQHVGSTYLILVAEIGPDKRNPVAHLFLDLKANSALDMLLALSLYSKSKSN